MPELTIHGAAMRTGERNPSVGPGTNWDNCEHEWCYPIDSMGENDVECRRCKCPGSVDDETGLVYWPAT